MSLNACLALEALPVEFLDGLSESGHKIILDAFFELDRASRGQQTPRDIQLQAALAICSGKDFLLHAGTGYGKTLAMIIPALLNRDKVVITISPLRLIQQNHVSLSYVIFTATSARFNCSVS